MPALLRLLCPGACLVLPVYGHSLLLLSPRFLVFPQLGRSLQSVLDDSPRHVLSLKCVLQVAYRLVRTSPCPGGERHGRAPAQQGEGW